MGRPISYQPLLALLLKNNTQRDSETDMTDMDRDTVFRISEIMFNMRIFAIEVR